MSLFLTITWEVGGIPADTFDIDYSLDNGQTWNTPLSITNETNYTVFNQPKSAVVEVPTMLQGEYVEFRIRGTKSGLDDSKFSDSTKVRYLTLPVMETLEATDIVYNGAELNGDISNVTGKDYTTEYYFRYREQGTQTWANTTPIGSTTTDVLVSEVITNLTQWTNYEYQLVGWNSVDEDEVVQGEVLTFKTPAVVPTISISSVNKVSQTEREFNGQISNVTGLGYTASYGFQWREVGETTWNEIILGTTTTDVNFDNLVDLPFNKNWEVRVVAWNHITKSETLTYSSIVTFDTDLDIPVVTTNDIGHDNLEELIFGIGISNVTGNLYTSEYGFEWRISGESTWNNTGIIGDTSTDLSDTFIQLIDEFDVTYEVRAYANNTSDPLNYVYGDIKTIEVESLTPAVGLYVPDEDTTSTTLTFEISYIDGPSFDAKYGVEYRIKGTSLWNDVGIVGSTSVDGTFSYTLNNLDSNEDYDYRIYVYNEFDETKISYSNQFDVLVVAGGGGGGWSTSSASDAGSGGGAGGYIDDSIELYEYDPIDCLIGSGGVGRSNSSPSSFGQGGNSKFGTLFEALGGGRGATNGDVSYLAPTNGGSGGGGSASHTKKFGEGLQPTSPDGGFGNDGGNYEFAFTGAEAIGSGGGGAGSKGTNPHYNCGTPSQAGYGGFGKEWYDGIRRAGGGGGGGSRIYFNSACDSHRYGRNGRDGGGRGGDGLNVNNRRAPENGSSNTGGGGGGTGNSSGDKAGDGGSGVIVVRYYGVPISSSGNNINQQDKYTYHYFNSNSNFVINNPPV